MTAIAMKAGFIRKIIRPSLAQEKSPLSCKVMDKNAPFSFGEGALGKLEVKYDESDRQDLLLQTILQEKLDYSRCVDCRRSAFGFFWLRVP